MSSQDGRDMDRPPPAGSVRRARERALAGLQREDVALPRNIPVNMDEEPQIARPSMPRPLGPNAGPQRLQRPPPPPGLQTRDGRIGVAISRPTPVPQWPLAAPSNSNIDPYQPPPGRSQPPQRPPRPSRVPSILDSSKVQDVTPVFQYRPQSGRDSTGQELLAVPETPSNLSRASTQSSVGSIPDFPLPAQLPPGPPRRSVNLGPPPSARRGASSFYSNASYVSPIPEESPRSRSHASFASSAAMPESWGEQSPGPSPNYPDVYYDDIIAEESAYGDDDEEESRLVRSASLGKRAKPTLVSATVPGLPNPRPGPTPVQNEPFKDGTGYVENSSSASTLPTLPKAAAGGPSITPDAMLNAYSSASATDPSDSSARPTPSPQPPPGGRPYSRLSAIRRPPRLDIDAVKKAESRGSLTSLPDLIRRATRLAASLEKGRRPASRFDDFDDYDERALSYDGEKHQSGFSDMLAAFPPPAHAAAAGASRRSWRGSIRQQVQSWPLPLGSSRSPNTSQEAMPGNSDSRPSPDGKRRRRCCGLPLWGFLVVMVVVVLLIAAAVAIPVEFFVVRRQRVSGEAQAALEQCQSQITCANGGSNVVNQGFCSCICTNGFTGFDCTLADSSGCTTISLTGDMAINNVTIGDAIPRLIQQAQTNFSIPLSSANIVAKLNSGNLSCSAMNALVTFDGSATRQAVVPPGVFGAAINGVVFTTVTILAGQFTTVTLNLGSTVKAAPTGAVGSVGGDGETGFTTIITAPGSFTTSFGTTITLGRATPTPTSTSTVIMTMSPGQAVPTTLFAVTDEVLDFSRVAVLYILQEENLNDAKVAQSRLQRLFTAASPANNGVSVETARNVTLENGNSIDLVDFVVSARGIARKVGKKPALKAREAPVTLTYEDPILLQHI